MGLVLFSMSEKLEDHISDNLQHSHQLRYNIFEKQCHQNNDHLASKINTNRNAKPQINVPNHNNNNIINLLIIKHLNQNQKQTIQIQIEDRATIKQIKQKIASKLRLNSESFKLCIPNLKPLTKTYLTLSDYGVSNGQTLLLKPRISAFSAGFQYTESIISIQYKGSKLKLNKDIKYFHTVYQLKVMIADTHSIPIRAQTLYFFDKNAQKVFLQQNKMLTDYFADIRSKIYLEVKFVHNKLLTLANCIDSAVMDEECNKIQQLFWSTMRRSEIELVSIYKIDKNVKQNLLIYENILSSITGMDNTAERERILFHGTSFENIEKIIVNGFNRDYNTRCMYGKGSYFAKYAKTAANYSKKNAASGVYAMLTCKVITGKYGLGNSSMNKPPQMYDSLVNDVRNPTIFVINRDYHAVPIYIILYKKFAKTQQKQYSHQQWVQWLKSNGHTRINL